MGKGREMDKRQVAAAVVVAALSAGCEQVEEYTRPVSAQVMVLGILNPQKDTIPVDDQLLGSVFLADATDVADIEEAPVEGAEAELRSSAGATVPLLEAEGGYYVATSFSGDGGMAYTEGGDFTAYAKTAEGEYAGTATAPAAIGFQEEGSCITADTALTLHLLSTDYDDLLVMVIDSDGRTTYSNVPTTASEFVALATNTEEPSETFEVPASAFPSSDAYGVFAIGVAGLKRTGSWGDSLNTLLSHYIIGAMKLGLVTTTCEVPARPTR